MKLNRTEAAAVVSIVVDPAYIHRLGTGRRGNRSSNWRSGDMGSRDSTIDSSCSGCSGSGNNNVGSNRKDVNNSGIGKTAKTAVAKRAAAITNEVLDIALTSLATSTAQAQQSLQAPYDGIIATELNCLPLKIKRGMIGMDKFSRYADLPLPVELLYILLD